MKTAGGMLLLASALMLSSRPGAGGPPALAVAADAASDVAAYEPKRRKGLGRVLDWSIAKLERVFDGGAVMDLISALFAKADEVFALMIRSFKEMAFSYADLRDAEAGRLERFDDEFRGVAKLRNAIDRRCLYASAGDERSLCVEKGAEINAKVKGLQWQRTKAARAVERYEGMMEWCASYKNWFC
mmetsp:Transcript_11909/g.35504  ORF Transcript_11909/g.35504 Transcript_11909/m.35504 type:complete len:186 (-) Transcript_11909:95-652(-)|eukprot:CAMPEP_0119286138 /NCGR_PEP_ID=MMETSP1329-20130426/33380_1 /TAXON_ID=114041 /ORGANISM="Genus nov. species nov., Strain RCC1024" /LENGTH=185 /DNA_ID=CAMNT_0007286869 /DNA_START=93 /DNA_END=650 /DNA_ORIENTATION=+